jgi:hypothetical protein
MFEIIVAAIIGLIIGFGVAGSFYTGSIDKDCRLMKQFRLSEKVFECKLVEKKND